MPDGQQFEPAGDGLLVRAPAKINLSLLIAGKRPDGFHELETIMAKIDLCDELLIEQVQVEAIELRCRGSHWAPDGPDNLVHKAAQEVFRLCGREQGIRLTLTKHIPAGSGLGGASSDAAATLIGLNEYLDLGLNLAQLADIAARLGSDVAFFLNGPLASCAGRGEKVSEIPVRFGFTALLILPDINVSTKRVYANYRHDPALYRQLRRQTADYLAQGHVESVARMGANMLQGSCFDLFGELRDLKRAVESLGIGSLCLSGSGSALFCILAGQAPEQTEILRDRIASGTGCRCVVVRNNPW